MFFSLCFEGKTGTGGSGRSRHCKMKGDCKRLSRTLKERLLANEMPINKVCKIFKNKLAMNNIIMDGKIMKYVWIVSCGAVAIFLFVLQLYSGGFDTGGLSVITASRILLLITAIIYELKLNKVLFYSMLSISLIMLVYGYFFASLL
jgi:hypothetical protein